MKRRISAILLSAVAALALVFAIPGTSDAAHPRRHHYHQYYGHYYRPDYSDYYRHGYYDGGYYYYGPRVQAYRYPGYYYYPHGGVHVGPFSYHW